MWVQDGGRVEARGLQHRVTREAAAEVAGPAEHGICQPGCDRFVATVLGPASFLVFVFWT